jgi:hypothetical protein
MIALGGSALVLTGSFPGIVSPRQAARRARGSSRAGEPQSPNNPAKRWVWLLSIVKARCGLFVHQSWVKPSPLVTCCSLPKHNVTCTGRVARKSATSTSWKLRCYDRQRNNCSSRPPVSNSYATIPIECPHNTSCTKLTCVHQDPHAARTKWFTRRTSSSLRPRLLHGPSLTQSWR